MIQLDQNALRDCIRDAIKEELHIFISGIRNTVVNTESTSSEKLLTKKRNGGRT